MKIYFFPSVAIVCVATFIFTSCQKNPEPCFSVSSAQINSGQTVTFTNCSANTVSYQWDFGDGVYSIEQSPVHTYAIAGNYKATLTAFSKSGKKSKTIEQTINVLAVVAAAVCFTPATGSPFTAATQPGSITDSDFNADGILDLAVTNENSNNVSILLGNVAGSFSAAVNFAVGTHPVWVASSDFNADGKSDLVVANGSSNNLSVLLGNGIGSFSVAVYQLLDFASLSES